MLNTNSFRMNIQLLSRPPVILRLLTLLLITLTPILGSASELMIKGSTTLQPILETVSKAYLAGHSNAEIKVSGGGSGAGLMALLKGKVDIAATSYMPTHEDLERFSAQGVYPMFFRIAYDCIIPVVHPTNPVKNLSQKQLRDIYSGKTTNWNSLGGPDLPIMVVDRNILSGTYRLWQSKIVANETSMIERITENSNIDVFSRVSQDHGAIGYIGIGYLNIRVKPLSINGESGSVRNVKNGNYLLSRPLFLVTRDWPKGQTLEFIDYILHPEKGQRLIDESGYMPLY